MAWAVAGVGTGVALIGATVLWRADANVMADQQNELARLRQQVAKLSPAQTPDSASTSTWSNVPASFGAYAPPPTLIPAGTQPAGDLFNASSPSGVP